MEPIDRNGIRAFSDPRYDYYELTLPLGGILPAGTIFVHDKEDHLRGSLAEGCLKLCWTPQGDCYHCPGNAGLCASTVIFHAGFKGSSLFRLVRGSDLRERIEALEAQEQTLRQEIETLKARL